MEELAADSIPVTADVAMEAYALPEPFHEDPADRILVATARLGKLTLLTADARILSYEGVNALDARK
jgi:PIN domain nuclease of toxin-antitoxin system